MKKIFLLFVIFAAGCSGLHVESTTKIIKNEKGEVSSEYTRVVKGEFAEGDKETAESWANADAISRSKPSEPSLRGRVVVKNDSSYAIEFMSGPYKGLILQPGEISTSGKYLPNGAVTYTIQWVNEDGQIKKWDFSRIISPSTDMIIIKNVVR